MEKPKKRPATSTARSTHLSPSSRGQNKKYKTEICNAYKPAGNENCKYGESCLYLHPEDKDFEKQYELYIKKKSHTDSIEQLHSDLAKASEELAKATGKLAKQKKALKDRIYNEIDQKVREWNNPHPNGPHYYDVHGMTREMLPAYIQEIVAKMEMSNVRKADVETGRGNNSPGNIPVLKDSLMSEYPPGMFVPDETNAGVLIYFLLRKLFCVCVCVSVCLGHLLE